LKTGLEKRIISDLSKFNPEKIILFGSQVRGDWDEESDIDIIVVYQTDKKFLDRLEELYMTWSLPVAVDILAYTPEEFTDMMEDNYFLKQSVDEGKIIYEKCL
jgi:predicted nucleotidyltransferase